MPLSIILAIFLALFTLGAKMHMSKSRSTEIMIIGGKQYNRMDKSDNRDTLLLKAPEQMDHKIYIKGRRNTGSFENIFSQVGLSRFIEEGEEEKEMESNNYITINVQQAAYMPVK